MLMLVSASRLHTLRLPSVKLTISGCRGFQSGSTKLSDSPTSLRRRTWPLQTLAIETSCDDTSVAILSVRPVSSVWEGEKQWLKSRVLFHERITADSSGFGGIHPLVALQSHQQNLACLVNEALEVVNRRSSLLSTRDGNGTWRPDFITVTRGPGMRANLSVGLDTAKGLAVAWNIPLVGCHHMMAHALTPRLVSTLRSPEDPNRIALDFKDGQPHEWSSKTLSPPYPFLSVLVSGGHTLLIDSQALTDHRILAETVDVAVGDCLDKVARDILPKELLISPFGKALETFAFPDGEDSYRSVYRPPSGRGEEIERRETEWGWGIGPPLSDSSGPDKSSRRMIYSFAGICTQAQRVVQSNPEATIDERRKLAAETLRVAFEHLASRILLHLTSLTPEEQHGIKTIVVSGGVASNLFLRHVLRTTLDVRGFPDVRLEFPPIELCTDNALMIAWAGIEMFLAGWTSELDIEPIRKWSLDHTAKDGGILGVGGWRNISVGQGG